MLDEHDRGRPIRSERPEAVEEGGRARRIEVRRRFVEDEDLGPRGQDPRARAAAADHPTDGGAPALKTPEAGLGDGFANANPHGIRRPVAILESERDVILDALHDQLRPGILEDEANVTGDFAPVRDPWVHARHAEVAADCPRDIAGDQPGEGKTQRALPRTRGADDEQARAGRHVERERANRRPIRGPVGDLEVASAKPRGRQAGNPSRTPVRRRERYSSTEPPAAMTAADTPMATSRTTWTSFEIVG